VVVVVVVVDGAGARLDVVEGGGDVTGVTDVSVESVAGEQHASISPMHVRSSEFLIPTKLRERVIWLRSDRTPQAVGRTEALGTISSVLGWNCGNLTDVGSIGAVRFGG
jgi:hypothetical protein